MVMKKSIRHFFIQFVIGVTTLVVSTNAMTSPNPQMTTDKQRQVLSQNGYHRWEWLKSSCVNCDLVVVSTDPRIGTPKVQAFIAALGNRKSDLLDLYQHHTHISSDEYNLLAQMAVGILGRESSFFESLRYRWKEEHPTIISILKILDVMLLHPNRSLTDNSRGPTQIKIIPQPIVDGYGVTPEELDVPENAAIATMGFLIEALTDMKRRIAKGQLKFETPIAYSVTPANYSDYLPYLYFGGGKILISGQATPSSNIYVREMKKYMQWVELYEKEPIQSLH